MAGEAMTAYRKRTQDAGHESPEAARNTAEWRRVIRADKERAYAVFLAWHDTPPNHHASMDFTAKVYPWDDEEDRFER
jgi:hypothetical protein